ncbi:hypothetical protein AAFA46_01950 [Oscillospiraceae bacterium WX1]
MRKNAVILPLLALIAGALGFAVRLYERQTVFDSTTGFPVMYAPVSLALIGLSVAVLVYAILAAVVTSGTHTAERSYTGAFAPEGFSYIGMSYLLAIVWLVSNVLYVLSLLKGNSAGLIQLFFIFLSVIAALSVMFLARAAYKGRGGAELLFFSIMPPLFYCFWLVVLYKENASNPVLLDYCYETLAIAAAALATYFSAGYVFKKAATGWTLFSYLTTIYFGTIVLADKSRMTGSTDLPILLIFAVTVAVAFINAVVFIKNLQDRDDVA